VYGGRCGKSRCQFPTRGDPTDPSETPHIRLVYPRISRTNTCDNTTQHNTTQHHTDAQRYTTGNIQNITFTLGSSFWRRFFSAPKYMTNCSYKHPFSPPQVLPKKFALTILIHLHIISTRPTQLPPYHLNTTPAYRNYYSNTTKTANIWGNTPHDTLHWGISPMTPYIGEIYRILTDLGRISRILTDLGKNPS
jgi:hypothetical protein